MSSAAINPKSYTKHIFILMQNKSYSIQFHTDICSIYSSECDILELDNPSADKSVSWSCRLFVLIGTTMLTGRKTFCILSAGRILCLWWLPSVAFTHEAPDDRQKHTTLQPRPSSTLNVWRVVQPKLGVRPQIIHLNWCFWPPGDCEPNFHCPSR